MIHREPARFLGQSPKFKLPALKRGRPVHQCDSPKVIIWLTARTSIAAETWPETLAALEELTLAVRGGFAPAGPTPSGCD